MPDFLDLEPLPAFGCPWARNLDDIPTARVCNNDDMSNVKHGGGMEEAGPPVVLRTHKFAILLLHAVLNRSQGVESGVKIIISLIIHKKITKYY